jgi:uncharacterized membrane protein
MMSGYGGGGWPVWAMVLMWAGTLVVLGVLIWGGHTVMASAAHRARQDRLHEADIQDEHGGKATRLILDERLARGQIDAAEYQSLRDLTATGDDHTPAGAGIQ